VGWKQAQGLNDGGPDKLSENQCGMETRDKQGKRAEPKPVEREPMWDGNLNGKTIFDNTLTS